MSKPKPQDVDEYIAGMNDSLKPVAERLRQLVREELDDVAEALKWSQPTYSIDGKNICYLSAAKAHLSFGFIEGKSLTDPAGLLEGGGQQMAHVKLRKPEDLNEKQIRAWLREAGDRATGG